MESRENDPPGRRAKKYVLIGRGRDALRGHSHRWLPRFTPVLGAPERHVVAPRPLEFVALVCILDSSGEPYSPAAQSDQRRFRSSADRVTLNVLSGKGLRPGDAAVIGGGKGRSSEVEDATPFKFDESRVVAEVGVMDGQHLLRTRHGNIRVFLGSDGPA